MGEVASQRVVVLGAGRVATHLVPALVQAGHKVVQVWSRTETSACVLAEAYGVAYTNELVAIEPDADVYIACLADEALPEVADNLLRLFAKADRAVKSTHDGEPLSNRLFLHTAGSVSMDVWQQAGAAHYGILYPLQTFSKERAVNMRDVSFFVEASDEEAMARTESLAISLSDKVYHADSRLREQLHIAAVFACNFTNAMYDVASQLLEKCKIPFEVLLPLIDETAAKVHALSPGSAQTGPAVRGDKAVMQKHMDVLNQENELKEIYALISNYISRNK